jgi:hypothetical protein
MVFVFDDDQEAVSVVAAGKGDFGVKGEKEGVKREVRKEVKETVGKEGGKGKDRSEKIGVKKSINKGTSHAKDLFKSSVQSLRTLLFDELSHSKNKDKNFKRMIGNFKDNRNVAIGLKAESSQKHSIKHIKQMKKDKERKVTEHLDACKNLGIANEHRFDRRVQVDRNKNKQGKEKYGRKQAAQLLDVQGAVRNVLGKKK